MFLEEFYILKETLLRATCVFFIMYKFHGIQAAKILSSHHLN